MATSGSLATSGGFESRNFLFTWEQTSQDVEANTTTISWTIKGTGGDTSLYYMAGPIVASINGSVIYSSTTRVKLTTRAAVASGTYIVKHNRVGEGSLSVEVEGAIYYKTVNSTGAKTWDLTTIPRASVPTLGSSTVELGKIVTIFTNTVSDRFRHKIFYNWYGKTNGEPTWVLIDQDVTTYKVWTVPETFAENLPGVTEGTGTIRCETWDGDSLIGTKDVTFKGVVPESFRPSTDIWVADPTGYREIYGDLVQGVSKMDINLNPTLSYGSPITKSITFANGAIYGTTEFSTDVVQDADSTEIKAQVTDERGRDSIVESYILPVIPYERPVVSALSVRRCDEDGTENDQGEYVQVTFSAKIYDLRGQNSAKYTLTYTADEDSHTEELTDLNGTYVLNNYTLEPFAADGSKTYQVTITAEDDIDEGDRSTSISTAFTIMSWGPDGTSMAIGKVAEKENTLEVALDMDVTGATTFKGSVVGVLPDTIDHIVEAGTEAMGSNGTWHWTKWASGRAECYGRRNYGNMAVNTAWGNMYKSPEFSQNLPTDLFADTPDFLNITIMSSNGGAFISRGISGASATQSGNFCVCGLIAAGMSQVHLGFHAIGRWK